MKKLDILANSFLKLCSVYYMVQSALMLFNVHVMDRFAVGIALLNLSLYFWIMSVTFITSNEK
jgi:hypothetical protein